MAQYNLINDCIITTVTGTLTGNREFSLEEIDTLYDGVTTSGIIINTSDIVYFDIDLINRTVVEKIGVTVIMNEDPSMFLNDVNFYYRNSADEPFCKLTTSSDDVGFFASYEDNSLAPLYVRATVSGIEGHLTEIYLNNSKYEVAFGENGTESAANIDSIVDYNEVLIYNNSDVEKQPVDAYVSIDYTHSPIDSCIKIAADPEGPYYSINDGVGIDYDSGSDYTWQAGKFDGTTTVNNVLKLLSYNQLPDFYETYSYKSDLPIEDQPTDAGWALAANCWDWQSPGVLYALGKQTAGGVLFIYKYTTATNKWAFIDTITTSYSIGGHTCMVCVDSFIYILFSQDGYFSRYNLNGEKGNIETLARCTVSSEILNDWALGLAMCSDKGNYIYVLFMNGHYHTGGFWRYNVSGNVWETLSKSFNINDSSNTTADFYCRFSASYDLAENAVYLDNGESTYGDGSIQRYDVATNTWMTNWHLQPAGYPYRTTSYYGGYMAFASYDHGYVIRVFNLYAQITVNFQLPYRPINGTQPYLLCFPDENGNVMVSITRINTGNIPEQIYTYLLGSAYSSVDTTILQVGYYTTPIFSVEDRYLASFLNAEYTTASGNSISVDDVAGKSFFYKSSNYPPVPYAKAFFGYRTTEGEYFIAQADLNSGSFSTGVNKFQVTTPTYDVVDRILFDSHTTSLLILVRETNGTNTSMFHRYNLETGDIDDKSAYSGDYVISDTNMLDVDSSGGIWGYHSKKLFRLSQDLSTTTYTYTDPEDFIACLSADKNYNSCWYSDIKNKNLVHLDYNGTSIASIAVTSPSYVSSTYDGGCFALDSIEHTITKFSYIGEIELSFSVDAAYVIKSITAIKSSSNDYKIWCLDGSHSVVIFNSDGSVLKIVSAPNAKSLIPYEEGCLVHSDENNVTYQFNSSGELIKEWKFSTFSSSVYSPCVVFIDYKTMVSNSIIYLHKDSDDPVWGDDTVGWGIGLLDKNRLPLKSFHQFKFRLTSNADSASPEISKIIMPRSVKIPNIASKTSKPVYVKVDFTSDLENKEYETKLRCWWGR